MLPTEQLPSLAAIYKSGDLTATKKTAALLDKFPSGQYVLLLDNFEDKLDPSTGAITEKEVDDALRALLNHQPHGIKVLLTTRIRPADLLLVGPGRQIVLDLDKGLESPFAENVLREMDREGTLGLKAAPESLLSEVRQRLLGYPRALEAFYAILAADRTASIADILRDTAKLPANVVEVLVGEAFNRLDIPAERVMQGLAIYNHPIPAVALDYLLKDHLPVGDTAPILRRLVNMHFVRREGDRYYLHPIDRNYALSRIPLGSEDDRLGWDQPFTQFALCARAAEYFLEIEKPREDWQCLQDLAPQLARFDLLLQGKDWDTALSLLEQIAQDYLIRWGHYALVLDLAGKLATYLEPEQESTRLDILASAYFDKGDRKSAAEYREKIYVLANEIGNDFDKMRARLNWAFTRSESLGDERGNIRTGRQALQFARWRGGLPQWLKMAHSRIGLAFCSLGKYSHAIRHLRHAIRIAQETKDLHGEEGDWHNLGSCLLSLGEIGQACEHFERALALWEKTRDPNWRANHIHLLGSCAFETGATLIARDFYRQELSVRQEIGDRLGESSALSGLASCLARFGQVDAALENCGAALAIARELGNPATEGDRLYNVGKPLIDAGQIPEARNSLAASIEIGLARGIPLASEYCALAFACVLEGDLIAANIASVQAGRYDEARTNDYRELIRGLVALREEHASFAKECFHKAITHADALLCRTSTQLSPLQNRALALCGLVLSGLSDHLADALRTFRALRAVNRDPGVIASDIQHLKPSQLGKQTTYSTRFEMPPVEFKWADCARTRTIR